MPTFEWLAKFDTEFRRLAPAQRAAFLIAVSHFVDDLRSGGPVRAGLRMKGVSGFAGIFELTWAPDGRATFEYGAQVRPGEAHIIWRRIGTHVIFERP